MNLIPDSMEEEYRIIEEPKKRPDNCPEGMRFRFEEHVDEKEGQFELGAYDSYTIRNMVRFLNDGYEPYMTAKTAETVLQRGMANNIDRTLSGPAIFRVMSRDRAAGIILLCNQLNLQICGVYECNPDDPVASAYAFVKACGDGTIKRKERAVLDELMECRRQCSYLLDVELPSVKRTDEWYETTMKVISRCYDIIVADKAEK